eukprot:m.38465 g.38465  ORF g.38465 m.38465 type:complete len:530 (+) comp10204_c0_seq2:165-1754(+)
MANVLDEWVNSLKAIGTTVLDFLNIKEVSALNIAKVAGLAYLGYASYNKLRYKIMLSGIPRPSGYIPFLGHALQLAGDGPWDVIFNWVQKNDFDMMCMDFLGNPGVVIADPERLRHVLSTKQSIYVKDIALSYKPFLNILGNGLVTSDGELWHKQRTLLSHALRVDILEETAPVAKRAADRLSVLLERHVESGEPIEIGEEFRILTLQVIGELILSLTPEESAEVFPNLYLPLVEEANQRIFQFWRPFCFWTKAQRVHRRTVKALNKYLCDLIRRRWNARQEALKAGKQTADDILEHILSDIDPATWSEATVLQLRDEIKTFILAGHETSASMMTWFIYLMSQHPEVKNKIVAEAREFLGSGLGSGATRDAMFASYELPDRSQVNNLKYTLNSLKETLRKYTLVPIITRIASKDDVLGGVRVPAGTKVFMSLTGVHNNPHAWKDPDQFRPERFDEDVIHPYAFLPFINGPRNCLGQNLALLESRIVVALLLLRFNFTPANPDAGIVGPKMVPIIPKNGMHMIVTHADSN